jgi:hypothetical protein
MSAVLSNVVSIPVVETPTVTVGQLAEHLFAARGAERAAEQARVAAEGALIAALGFDKSEGQSTETIGDLKVTIKAGTTTKVDWDKLDEILPSIPTQLHPVKIERKLDAAGVKYLAENHADLYRKVARALTVTPAKTSVTIVRVA